MQSVAAYSQWLCDRAAGEEGRVVSCETRVVKEHMLSPATSDIVNVMSHKAVGRHVVGNNGLVGRWVGLLGRLQGMDMLVKRTEDHVEYERETWVQAFGLEMEMSGLALAQLAATCDPADEAYDRQGASTMSKAVVQQLDVAFDGAGMHLETGDGLDALGLLAGHRVVVHQVSGKSSALAGRKCMTGRFVATQTEPAVHRASYHIPLHRWLAAFGGALVIKGGAAVHAVLGDTAARQAADYIKLLLEQPVLIQVCQVQTSTGGGGRHALMGAGVPCCRC